MDNMLSLRTAAGAKWSRRRALRLVASVLTLGLLGTNLSIGFLSSVSGIGAAPLSEHVFMLGAGDVSAPSAITSSVFGGRRQRASTVPGQLPNWSPTVGQSGSVQRGGDLAIVDASSVATALDATVYLVNSAALSRDYSNLELPIDVYYSAMNGPASSPASAPCPTTTGCDWQRANGAGHAPRALSRVAKLSNSVGSLTLRLPPGAYYEIVVPTGGTYFCVATTESASASLSPSFFVSVQKA